MLSNAVELVAPTSDRMHANAFSVAATVKISTFLKKGCKKKTSFQISLESRGSCRVGVISGLFLRPHPLAAQFCGL